MLDPVYRYRTPEVFRFGALRPLTPEALRAYPTANLPADYLAAWQAECGYRSWSHSRGASVVEK